MLYESNSHKDTFEVGRKLAMSACPGQIYCLSGDLGVGKTVFTQGFAAGLGIDEPVCSPTFTIVREYDNALPFYHFDVYRIGDVSEMEEIGYEDYFYGDGVCMIEWAEKIREILPPCHTYITLSKDLSKGINYRMIRVERKRSRNGGYIEQ